MTGIDPINFMVSPEMLSSNKENVEALRESLGLNDPLIVQYFRWLGNCLKGDLGYSFDGSSIASVIAVRLPYTFEDVYKRQGLYYPRSKTQSGCTDIFRIFRRQSSSDGAWKSGRPDGRRLYGVPADRKEIKAYRNKKHKKEHKNGGFSVVICSLLGRQVK